MTRPALIIFDCDGVLVDSEPLTNVIIAANLTRHGLPMSPDETHQLFTGGTLKGVGEAAVKMGAVLPEGWVDALYAETFAGLAQGVALFPGIWELLDQIACAGIAVAIASNGPMAKMEITLRPSGLWDRFEGRIYSGHDFKPKPAPDMLLHACKVAGVTPAQALMIDDSAAGCASAQAAGVPCLGFLPEGPPDALQAVGAKVVRSMTEIADMLR